MAAFSISEVAELFDVSERTIRRWVSENFLYRRDDGLFPLVTTAFWWLALHQRKVDPYEDPEMDFTMLVTKLLGWLGFSHYNEKMLSIAEFLWTIPVTQACFEEAKTLLTQEVRNAPKSKR